MARIQLTPDLPPQTAAYKRFEKTNVELNRFYWTFKCALDYILPAMKNVKTVPELLSGQSGVQLNIPSAKFVGESPDTERVARHSMLVLSVTAFEEYMRDVLTAFLIKNWKPDKTCRLTFRPQDLPAAADTHDWLRHKTIQAIVDEYLARSYQSRFDAVSRLIVECGAKQPTLSKNAQELAAQACEARNCIVHTSGVLDARAVAALTSLILGIKAGDVLVVSQDLLWQFLGALRDSARALDVPLRAMP